MNADPRRSESERRAGEGRDFSARRAELLERDRIGAGQRDALTTITDEWLRELFGASAARLPGAALIATGGYGRSELALGSDLDLVLVVPAASRAAEVQAAAERIWYPVWDAGIRLDHSVRSAAEVSRLAKSDLRVVLGMLDARTVAGDSAITEALRSSVLADWRAKARTRLPELIHDAAERAGRHGEVAFALEPNLKLGRGGLRDITVLRAVKASWVTEIPPADVGLAQALLLDTRDALHLATGRATDRLVQQEQDVVAERLAVGDRDVLLRRVGAAGRAVAYAMDLAAHGVEQANRSRLGRRGGGARTPLADGVVQQGGDVVLARDARPGKDPGLVLRAALAAAEHRLHLSPHTLGRLTAETPAPGEPWPSALRDDFVSLLGTGPHLVPVWEALDQAGLIERWIPDWGRVRSRPQRNPVHRFTVDRHLVETAAQATRLTRRVERPDLLLIAALFHDIGKGWPGDHTRAGEVIARDLVPRLGFGPADTELVVAMIRLHLLLPDVATRRDLDDPRTIAGVAEAVESQELLALLHALAEADGLATGPAAWGDWKAGLVSELARRVGASLTGAGPRGGSTPAPQEIAPAGVGDPADVTVSMRTRDFGLEVMVAAPDQRGLLGAVAGVLCLHRLTVRSADTVVRGARAVQVWTVVPTFGRPPDPLVIRDDVRRVLAGALDPGLRLQRREDAEPDRRGLGSAPPCVGFLEDVSDTASVLEVRAHDRPALLFKLGATLSETGVDVRAARITTLGAEAVDVFYLVHGGKPLEPLVRERVLGAVRGTLTMMVPVPTRG